MWVESSCKWQRELEIIGAGFRPALDAKISMMMVMIIIIIMIHSVVFILHCCPKVSRKPKAPWNAQPPWLEKGNFIENRNPKFMSIDGCVERTLLRKLQLNWENSSELLLRGA